MTIRDHSHATDAADLSAGELLELYRRRQLSPVEATEAALGRIECHNDALNAFCLVDAPFALEAARASEHRWARGEPCGLLDGVPTSIKDLILTRGWPTLRGSRAVDPAQAWEVDAPCTARLRAHGAVLIGKTTTPEFGWKGVTDSPLTGITRNPWDASLTSGGSSGGSAVAVATGMGPLAVGSDGGGSIRIPCGFTGVFGLKPSFGRVPSAPPSPFGTLTQVGPMSRGVADAALMLNVLSEPDPRDWHALPPDRRDYRVGIEDGVRSLRIAYSPTLGYAQVEGEVAEIVHRAAGVFESLGARVEIADPGFASPEATFACHWFAGAANLVRLLEPAQLERCDPGFIELAELGARIPLLEYLSATGERAALGQAMNEFHTHHDLLLTPTLPIPAFRAGLDRPEYHDPEQWIDWSPFSYPFNLTGQPAASVPCGLTSAGLPVGLQIVGPLHDDALVLRACRAFEAACPFPRVSLER